MQLRQNNHNKTENIMILGSGPTGLGAGYHLQKLGYSNWRIFERAGHVGGLSASFVDGQGFTWDIGGHVLFSHYKYFDDAIAAALGSGCYEHFRESWIRVLSSWVPYPFQNNIRHLPPAALEECLQALKELSGRHKETRNFHEWMNQVFGSGIVRYFMEPYNKKVWAVPLELMSKDWIAERVSVIDQSRIEKNIAENRDDVSWGPNNKFKFPRTGGTGAIFEAIAFPFRHRISFSHEVERVDLGKKRIMFKDGETLEYDSLINTTPLDQFIHKCTAVPKSVNKAAENLVHNSGLIVGLGFRGKRFDRKCWMYFPESNSPFYRVTNFHNYSPYNVPNGDIDNYFSLMCETSYSHYKKIDKGEIVDLTIEGLIASGMITERESDKIVSRYVVDVPYSYPVPTLERDAALDVIQPFLESHDVYSRGRFGAWKYEVGNMDHSFMQGVEVIDRILLRMPEMTINGKVLNK